MTGPRLNPVRAIRLLSGLNAMPDSLYRARVLQEHTEAGGFDDTNGDSNSKPVVLPWLGWDSSMMLLADVRNMMDGYLAAKADNRKVKANPVHPPSYTPPRELPTHGEVSALDFVRIAHMIGKTNATV